MMPKCTDCEKILIWGGDHSYEDEGLEGDGTVTNYSCSNKYCKVETLLIYKEI